MGVYPVDETTSRTIFIDGGKLFSQRTGGDAAELLNVAKDEFLYKDSFDRAKFQVEGNKAVGMYFGQEKAAGNCFVKSDKPVPAPKNVIKLTEAQLKRLEGKYEIAPTFAIVVKVVEGKIQVRAAGQQAFEIFPTSEYDFFLKAVDAQLEFQKGTDGKITGLVLHQGGQKTPAKKVIN